MKRKKMADVFIPILSTSRGKTLKLTLMTTNKGKISNRIR